MFEAAQREVLHLLRRNVFEHFCTSEAAQICQLVIAGSQVGGLLCSFAVFFIVC